MRTEWSATAFLPAENTLPELRSAASNCKGCPLWRNATLTVFGSGKQSAEFLFVGEQPGNKEDTAGKPFVGPAGRILDRALRLAGIQREAVYITNAVKHFKWTPKENAESTKSHPLAKFWLVDLGYKPRFRRSRRGPSYVSVPQQLKQFWVDRQKFLRIGGKRFRPIFANVCLLPCTRRLCCEFKNQISVRKRWNNSLLI